MLTLNQTSSHIRGWLSQFLFFSGKKSIKPNNLSTYHCQWCFFYKCLFTFVVLRFSVLKRFLTCCIWNLWFPWWVHTYHQGSPRRACWTSHELSLCCGHWVSWSYRRSSGWNARCYFNSLSFTILKVESLVGSDKVKFTGTAFLGWPINIRTLPVCWR